MSGKNSFQAVLNILGFMFIVVGLGIDGPVSFVLLGAAVLIFIVAILVAISGNSDEEETDAG